MRFLLSSLVFLSGFLAISIESRAELFEDGETVCFLGDSITARGLYQSIIADYYLTRFPGRTIRFVNAGRSGDTAGGALNRLEEDVIAKKPTTVVIMFGMNDVSRGSYVADPDEKTLERQEQALERYRHNQETLVARIREEAGDPKLIFLTPSPFDQTVELERENQPGCNDGLGRCAAIVRELAAKNGAQVVDLHGPMTALNLEQQKKDPTWTIIGPDRVHPATPGHLMMAWLILKAQGAPPLVSKVVVDAKAGAATESVRAEVSEVRKQDGGLAFTVLAQALPFPIDPAAKEILAIRPIETNLNRELLSVTDLSPGEYELRIDDSVVGKYSATDLGKGIDLASNPATPQFARAREVAKLNGQRRSAESEACSLLNSRRWMQSHYKVDVEDPAAVQAHYDHFEDKTEYSAVMARRYIEKWPHYDNLCKQAAEFEAEALTARTPQAHKFVLVPLQTRPH